VAGLSRFLTPPRSRNLAIFLCHFVAFFAAYRLAYSTSGFLVTALGLSLILDRFLLRPRPTWRREVGFAAGALLVGGAAFYFMRPGIVPFWEAAYRGFIVGAVCLGVEAVAGVCERFRWAIRGGVIAIAILLSPLIGGLHPLHTVPKRTPAALGFAFEEVRFRTEDSVELRGWFIRHPNPRGNVIFCHGHGRNRGHVAGLLTTFRDLRLNVLAFDFRGHGESGGHTSTFGHREVCDLIAAEAFLRQQCPNQPLLLAGVSLGAAVSLQTLPHLPNVKGVWSEGAFARLSHAVDHKFAAVPEALRGDLIRSYYVLGWLDCGMWGGSVNSLDGLHGSTVPIYFCHAIKDDLVPFSEARLLFANYPGPKEHWWVEGASHFNIRQRNHDEYPRRLRVFFEKCLECRRTESLDLRP
jgi:fermentation-respiration switch protein FrsA (DUF1100 family)